jgi:hypothetical protein
MNQRDTDLAMLVELIEKHLDDLSEIEVEAFTSMRWDLTAYQNNTTHRGFEQLTDKQRSWLTGVHKRIIPDYENLASSGAIPPPKKPGEPGYVALMVGALPKRPPPMPKEPLRPQRVTAEHRPFKVTGLDEPGEDDE